MPKWLHQQLEKKAKKLNLSKEKKDAYVYGTLNLYKKRKKISKYPDGGKVKRRKEIRMNEFKSHVLNSKYDEYLNPIKKNSFKQEKGLPDNLSKEEFNNYLNFRGYYNTGVFGWPQYGSKAGNNTWDDYKHMTNLKRVAVKGEEEKFIKEQGAPIEEYSLGGILASTGSGALGAAALGPWGAAAGGALGLFQGLMGHKGEKDQMDLMSQQQAEQEKLLQEQKDATTVDYQSSNTFANRYLPTFARGGLVPGMEPNAELEKNEVTVGSDGNIQKFDLPTHKYATADSQVALEPGTKIYSDRLKTSNGKTFAEEANEIKKQINKYEKILNL